MRDSVPVALFVYRREDHARKTIESLAANEGANSTDLFVFSDGAKDDEDAADVARVREYIRQIRGFRTVTISCNVENIGLAASIVRGVSKTLERHESVIVVEDDVVTSRYFLKFMNDSLYAYRDDDRVISVSGYMFPTRDALPDTFFIKGIESWGWATWRRAWKLFNPDGLSLLRSMESVGGEREFNFNSSFSYVQMLRAQVAGLNDSWAIRWYATAFLNNKLTLFPGRSLVHNIGNDGSGAHGGASTNFDVIPAAVPITVYRIPIEESDVGRKAFQAFFRRVTSRRYRIASRVGRTLQTFRRFFTIIFL